MQKFKKLIFSDILYYSSHTQKIAYISLMTALLVVCNMFFEFKLADTQFSLTIFFSALTGIVIGPIFGFVACFLGDLVGFLYNSGGFAYAPWIGISMGLIALTSGFIMNSFQVKSKPIVYIKLFVVCIITFSVCTVAINTTLFWISFNRMKTPYMIYLATRLFVQGQIWNSLANYLLLFLAYPFILRLKDLIKKTKNVEQSED